MHLMLDRARAAGHPVTRAAAARKRQRDPDFFDGLDHWFDRVERVCRLISACELDHYIVSSVHLRDDRRLPAFPAKISPSLRVTLSLRRKAGEAKWPGVAINYTTKTQFLFRINKGIDNVHDTEAINRWMRTE